MSKSKLSNDASICSREVHQLPMIMLFETNAYDQFTLADPIFGSVRQQVQQIE
jgi:hypothetical protein